MQFSTVVGQKQIKARLINEVDSDKISHAQLFLGKPGYGSLPLVLAFVQYLFCTNRSNSDSCGECSSCRKVSNLQHPDVHFSYPTVQTISKTSDGLLKEWREQLISNPYFNLNSWIRKTDPKERKPIIGKDESQAVIKKLSLRSYEGGYKVMIIWMAEEMNVTSANKLLKIIEEPPKDTLFLLMAESQEYMIQTILSRTQTILVPRIEMDALSNFLRKSGTLGAEKSDSIAARSEGDLIEAQELIGDHAEHDENYKCFTQLMRVCYKKNVLEMLDWAESMAQTSMEHQKVFIKYALHMFRQSILKNYTEDQLTRTSANEEGFLENFSRFITGNNIIDFTNRFDKAHYHIERNANSKILFTNLCFDVMRFIHVA